MFIAISSIAGAERPRVEFLLEEQGIFRSWRLEPKT